MKETVPSPCIAVCTMDSDTGLCKGCFRNIDEVKEWLLYSDDTKRQKWLALEERRAAADEDPHPWVGLVFNDK